MKIEQSFFPTKDGAGQSRFNPEFFPTKRYLCTVVLKIVIIMPITYYRCDSDNSPKNKLHRFYCTYNCSCYCTVFRKEDTSNGQTSATEPQSCSLRVPVMQFWMTMMTVT